MFSWQRRHFWEGDIITTQCHGIFCVFLLFYLACFVSPLLRFLSHSRLQETKLTPLLVYDSFWNRFLPRTFQQTINSRVIFKGDHAYIFPPRRESTSSPKEFTPLPNKWSSSFINDFTPLPMFLHFQVLNRCLLATVYFTTMCKLDSRSYFSQREEITIYFSQKLNQQVYATTIILVFASCICSHIQEINQKLIIPKLLKRSLELCHLYSLIIMII